MLLIRNISQLLTFAGEPQPLRGTAMAEPCLIENAALLIENSRFYAVGTKEEIENSPEARQAEVFNAHGCAVLPGFCDSHTHPVFAKTREDEYEMLIQGASYEEIAKRGGGILNSVRALRNTPKSILIDMAVRRAEEFLKYGTTSIEAKTGYGLDLESELKMLRVIAAMSRQTPLETVSTFLGAHEIPPEYRRNRRGYVKHLCEQMIPAVADSGLATYCDVFCEKGIFTVADARKILKTALKYGLKPKLHADQLSLSGGTMLGVELGAVSVDHLEKIGKKEITALAKSETIATLLPGSVLHLRLKKYPPARALVDRGAAVALATDFNPGSSPSLNMQMTISLACTQMRMTPAEAMAAATINGAWAMGRGRLIGAIEPGRQADFIISDVPDYRLIPYHFGMNHCRAVFKKGKPV